MRCAGYFARCHSKPGRQPTEGDLGHCAAFGSVVPAGIGEAALTTVRINDRAADEVQ